MNEMNIQEQGILPSGEAALVLRPAVVRGSWGLLGVFGLFTPTYPAIPQIQFFKYFSNTLDFWDTKLKN